MLSRAQSPEKLFEAGSRGSPLVLYGIRDTHLKGEVVSECMKEHFKRIKVHTGPGSHTLFIDNKAEKFLQALIEFAVNTSSSVHWVCSALFRDY